jgi:hypothetical protein
MTTITSNFEQERQAVRALEERLDEIGEKDFSECLGDEEIREMHDRVVSDLHGAGSREALGRVVLTELLPFVVEIQAEARITEFAAALIRSLGIERDEKLAALGENPFAVLLAGVEQLVERRADAARVKALREELEGLRDNLARESREIAKARADRKHYYLGGELQSAFSR